MTAEEASVYAGSKRVGAVLRAAAQMVAEGVPLSPEEGSRYLASKTGGLNRGGKRDLPRGVFQVKSGRYRASISIRTAGVKRSQYLGSFDTPEEAARAFDEAAIRRWQAGLVPELVTNYPPEGYPGYTGHVGQVADAAARKAQGAAGGAEEEGEAPAKADGRGKATGARIRAAAEKLKAGLEPTEEEARVYASTKAAGAAAGAVFRAVAQKVAEGAPLRPEGAGRYKATQLNGMKTDGKRKRDLPRGVFQVKSGRYRASIGIRTAGVCRVEHLGLFDTPEEAARAFDEAAIRRWQAGLVPELVTNYPPEGYPGYTGHVGQVADAAARKAQGAAGGAEEEGEAPAKADGRGKATGARIRAAAEKLKAGLEPTEEEARAYAAMKAGGAATGAVLRAAAQKVAEGVPLSPEEGSRYLASKTGGLNRGGKRDLPRGVFQVKSGRYRASISIRTAGVKRSQYLGSFDTPEETARAFDEAAIRRWQAGLVSELVTNYPPEGYPENTGHTRPVMGAAARKAQQAAGGAEEGKAQPKTDGQARWAALKRAAAQKVKAGQELTEEERRAYEAVSKAGKAGGAAAGASRRAAAQKAKAGLELTEEEARAYAGLKAAAAATAALRRAVVQKVKAGLELTEQERRVHEGAIKAGAVVRAVAQKVAEGAPLSPEEASRYKATQMTGMRRGGKRDLPRGVCKARSGRYEARIGIRTGGVQRNLHLGTFDTPEEAAHAFDEAAIRRWQAGLVPELVTNYPPEGYPGYTGVVEQGVQGE
ncbi:hypothetical protein HYH03_014152 [Edaphochlamys debaryana]|uniref:AP2/ERF domain-containing protein n=1 Tax=Edaphochlamys debaryana TaxID=47281 RepID=A0A835XLS4_9CHLO|nr:hypothetical protein HYH03_014152 [Edaphochlamys debaryana]|eukprot:KAG2487172.1 hypothetical protein HYH03_014152 [Edaphochlamys debaryana]